MKYSGQILDQLTEIHTPVRCEIKQDLAAVKGILCTDHLHVQLVLTGLLAADLQCFLFLLADLGKLYLVLLCGNTKHLSERLRNLVIRDHLIAGGDHTILRPLGGLHNYVIPDAQGKLFRIEIVYLACVAESHANDLNHTDNTFTLILLICRLSLRSAAASLRL